MPKISLNLADAVSLKPIEEGDYVATVLEIGAVKKGPKAHFCPVKLEISDGSEAEGRPFYINLPIEGAGAGIFVDFINKVTGSELDVDDLSDLDYDTDDLIGGEIILIIKTEEYPEDSGEFRSQVKSTARVSA